MKFILPGIFVLSGWLSLHAQDRPKPSVRLLKDQPVLALYKPAPAPASATTEIKALIKGTVSDEKGNTLPGATISVKGTQLGTTTDANGQFSLNCTRQRLKRWLFPTSA